MFYDDLYAATEGTFTEETVIVEEEVNPFGATEADPFAEDTHPEGFGPDAAKEPETPVVPEAPETPEAPKDNNEPK